MAEAEALADDIHVLVEGRLVASGSSSSSLKAKYGSGYTLKVVLDRQQQQRQGSKEHSNTATGASKLASDVRPLQQNTAVEAEHRMAAAAADVINLVRQRIPTAELLSAAGAELSFRILQASCEAAAELLDTITARQAELGIASYAFSDTTLQEVRD
jgi:ABC-type multidrug transport system ATPase subunit